MQVQVINKSQNELPKYETGNSAGCDIRSTVYTELKPGARQLVPTGLYVAIPDGYEIQVRPRSGLALKHGITVLNTPGTIDADYRGEIGVILMNHSNDTFIVRPQERIGQLVLNKVEQIEWSQVSELDTTDRGDGGFGSTGK